MAFPFFKRSSRLDFSGLEPKESRAISIPTGSGLRSFIQEMQPGDKAITGVLLLLLAIGIFASAGIFIRSFQIAVPAYGGTLTEGVVGSPRFANPLLAISDSDRDLVALTYAGLMGHDSAGNLIPVLAENYSVSEDGKTYTFILRQGAIFSDDTPVTAEDVVYTIQKAQDPALKSPVYANWANIRVEAVDATKVRFTLPQPYALFLEDATLGILPEHVWQNVHDEEFPFAAYTTEPVAAGPFTVSSVTRNDAGTITDYALSSFKGYVLGRPYLSRIHLSFYTAQADLQKALSEGRIQSAYGISSETAVHVPYARVFGVFFNPAQQEALEDTDLRKALSLAIDRTTLTKEVLGGYATPIAGPLPAGGSVRAIPLPDDATRMQQARDALSEAGYEYSEDSKTWTKDGATLSMTLSTSNVPELKAVAAQIQKDWQTLGISTELSFYSSEDLSQTVIRPRAYSALLFGEVIGTQPDLYAFWASSEREAPGLNIANYDNADVDALLSTARSSSDAQKAKEALSQAQEAIAADYPAAFLYSPEFLYARQETLHGVNLSAVSAPSERFWGISSWYRYTEHVWPAFVHERTASI